MERVETRRIYSWALATRVGGEVSSATVDEALRQVRSAGVPRVWLLDAAGASSADPSALPALSSAAQELSAAGLQYLAVVVPPSVRDYIGLIGAGAPIALVSFESSNEAFAWIQRGCR